MVKLILINLEGIKMTKQYDLAIIGAGPIGLYTATYSSQNELSTILFDSLESVGGQPEFLYPYKKMVNIPGHRVIRAKALIDQLRADLSDDIKIVTNHKVTDLKIADDEFIIDGEYHAKKLIIASGCGSFAPKTLPDRLVNDCSEHVSYFITDPSEFKGKKMAVLGGGDTAMDIANELSEYTDVTIIHRRPNFRGLESTLTKLKNNPKVSFLTPYLPKMMKMVDNKVEITFKEAGGTDQQVDYFDEIVVAYGFRANNKFVQAWGIDATSSHISVNRSMETSVSGIYAVGDVVDYEGRVPLIGVGFGEAQIAVHAIMRELCPEKLG